MNTQLENYLLLQDIHDHFWIYTLQITAPYLSLLSSAFPVFAAARTKLYLCSEGLLIITRKKEEAVRWDDVKEFFTSRCHRDVMSLPLLHKRSSPILIKETETQFNKKNTTTTLARLDRGISCRRILCH